MQRRQGFTIVELLVAMALTLFIMVILTSAFVTGLDTFRGLKGIGDMQEGLRTVAQRLREDLQANHFEGDRKLSDPVMMDANLLEPWESRKPVQGFFRVSQGTGSKLPYDDNEGIDADGGPPSFRATDHYIHFTVNLRGPRQEKFFTATMPPKTAIPHLTDYYTTLRFPSDPQLQDARYQNPKERVYTSQWAEIAYYLELDPTGVTAAGTPLFNLYRVQRVVIPSDDFIEHKIPNNQLDEYGEFSCQPDIANNGLDFKTPSELNKLPIVRSFTFRTGAYAPGGKKYGASLLLSNVVSFQLQVPVRNATTGEINFFDLPVNPHLDNTANERIFDSAYLDNTPAGQNLSSIIGVRAILRVWDPKTDQTRQMTIYQDL